MSRSGPIWFCNADAVLCLKGNVTISVACQDKQSWLLSDKAENIEDNTYYFELDVQLFFPLNEKFFIKRTLFYLVHQIKSFLSVLQEVTKLISLVRVSDLT